MEGEVAVRVAFRSVDAPHPHHIADGSQLLGRDLIPSSADRDSIASSLSDGSSRIAGQKKMLKPRSGVILFVC